MGFPKRLFDFYINSSIHVSIAVCCLAIVTLLEFGITIDSQLIIFIFLASVTGYNFIKYFGLARFHHRRLSAWLKWIQIFSLFAFLGLVYLAFFMGMRTLLYFTGFGIVAFLYAAPFLPSRLFTEGDVNLRNISGLKIWIIALVWAGITVIIPLVHSGAAWQTDWLLTFIQRYLYIIVATLPFEIRDMRFDSPTLGTIPQKFGIGPTKTIGGVMLVVFLILEIVKSGYNLRALLIVLAVAIATFLMLLGSTRDQSKYYSSFWVEGIPLLWLLLLLLF